MKMIVNTELIQVIDTGAEYKVLLQAKDGSIIEHEPFRRDLQGLVGALTLSAEVCAGKFFLKGIVNTIDFKETKKLKGK